jgi:conjugative transfer pilus assembly protein TraH
MGPLRLVTVQTPKFSAGCGGIDFYAGGFSAINKDQFVRHLRAIGQNASSLAFMLAIQIVSPQLSGIMKDIQTWSQKFLQMNMDSCQAATALVGGALDQFGAEEGNCTVTRMNSHGEDWTTANYACTTGGKRKEAEEDGIPPNQIDFVKGNLAWYVLMQDPFFRADTDISELIMNITGTIIVKDASGDDDSPSNIRMIDPVLQGSVKSERFMNIYNALLYGATAASTIQLYRCEDVGTEDTACQTVSSDLRSMSTPNSGIHARVSTLITSIAEKIGGDGALTNEEQGLISSTSIPLYRFLSSSSGVFPGSSGLASYSGELTRVIAEDIMLRALRSMITNVKQAAAMLPGMMSQAPRIKTYTKNLEAVLRGIARIGERNKEKADELYAMRERIAMYEQTLMNKLGGRVAAALNWAP